jgi:hypothetical protein
MQAILSNPGPVKSASYFNLTPKEIASLTEALIAREDKSASRGGGAARRVGEGGGVAWPQSAPAAVGTRRRRAAPGATAAPAAPAAAQACLPRPPTAAAAAAAAGPAIASDLDAVAASKAKPSWDATIGPLLDSSSAEGIMSNVM